VEFALTIGLLMVLVVATAQVAIYLHYRNSLALACQEGAFQAALAGHSLDDGARAALDLWQKLEPSGAPVSVATSQSGFVTISMRGSSPAILPVPIPPFTKIPIAAQCVHTIERFQPGSSP
jgi:Flp pilus assembly protein TadG